MPDRLPEIEQVFREHAPATDALVAGFDIDQLATIAEFLERSVSFAYNRAALLRAQALAGGGSRPRTRKSLRVEQ